MCWNAKVSLQTFVFSLVPLLLCYSLNLIPFSVYILFQTFITIQLIEYFLWTYLDTEWNSFFSKIGFLLIMILPLSTILFSKIPYILELYLCFVFYLFTYPINFHTSIAKNKHLSWDWLRFPIPILLLWTAFFLLPCFDSINILSVFTVVTFFVTLFTYYSTNTFGSMWCWIANINSLYLYSLLLRYFL